MCGLTEVMLFCGTPYQGSTPNAATEHEFMSLTLSVGKIGVSETCLGATHYHRQRDNGQYAFKNKTEHFIYVQSNNSF